MATGIGRIGPRVALAGTLLAFMIVAMLVNSIGIVIMESVGRLGIGRVPAAHLVTIQMGSALVAALFVAPRVPRFGHRRSLIAAMAALTAATLTMAVARGFWAMQGGAAISGFTFVIVKVVAYDTIAAIAREPARHASLIALAEAVFAGGTVTGFVLFAGFADTDWRHAYFVLAALSVAATGMVIAAAPPLCRTAIAVSGHRPDARSMARVATTPTVPLMLVAVFAYVLVEQGLTAWLPTFNRETLHLTAPRAILMAGAFGASMAIGRAGAAIALRRMPASRVLAGAGGALVLLLATTALLSWLGVVPDIAPILPLAGVFLAPFFPVLNAAALIRSPQGDHSALVGLSIVIATLGGAMGAVLAGELIDRGNGVATLLAPLLPLGVVLVAAHGLLRLPVDSQERP